jgi:tRNA/tmRNA/rRNA uracil-C5-methylase (TrmA/RlmC/RlmD family)
MNSEINRKENWDMEMEEVMSVYKRLNQTFQEDGFELTMSEAAYLREQIKDVLRKNKLMESDFSKGNEIEEPEERLFREYFGIDRGSYYFDIKNKSFFDPVYKERIRQLYEYIKKNVRPEKEELELNDDKQE